MRAKDSATRRIGARALGWGLLLALLPFPSLADDNATVDNATGGGGTPGQVLTLSAADRTRLTEKLAEAARYRTQARPSRATAQGSAAAIPVPTRILAVTHVGQVENYYCGPAAAVMIARYKRMGDSAYDHSTLTQRHMASAAHLRTDVNGRTSFTTGLFARGLNRWRGGRFFQQLANPTNAQFRDAFVTDIGAHDMPLGVSTIEFADGAHYNHHPANQLIGHWIVGRGFENFAADAVHLVDPAADAPGLSQRWDHAAKYFRAPTNLFNQRHVSYQDHGLVW